MTSSLTMKLGAVAGLIVMSGLLTSCTSTPSRDAQAEKKAFEICLVDLNDAVLYYEWSDNVVNADNSPVTPLSGSIGSDNNMCVYSRPGMTSYPITLKIGDEEAPGFYNLFKISNPSSPSIAITSTTYGSWNYNLVPDKPEFWDSDFLAQGVVLLKDVRMFPASPSDDVIYIKRTN